LTNTDTLLLREMSPDGTEPVANGLIMDRRSQN